ncbi:MAG: hypothetical protein ABH859_06470 [Pseudomonadota bacterium]
MAKIALAKTQVEDEFEEETLPEEEIPEEEPLDDQELLDEEQPLPEEEPLEDEFVDEKEEPVEPVIPGRRIPPPPPTAADTASTDEERAGEELRNIVIDAIVRLNYVFDNSPDSFVIKYAIHFEGKTAAKVAVVKGNASISTEVEGFLAKWPTGQCKLSVTIPDTAFGLTFSRTSDEQATLNLRFTNPIIETWESECSFKDAPEAKFNTKGDPEKWLAKALQNTSPPLAQLTVPLARDESSTMKFVINKQMLKDPPLGTAEIEGTGVVTINSGR